MKRTYQKNYSDIKKEMYDIEDREKKAKTMVAVLEDYYSSHSIREKSVLDIGASTGIIDNYLARYFQSVTGVDIDDKGVKYAASTYKKDNLTFLVGDAMDLQFQANSFDIVICSQVYEHVPDAFSMMNEIYRVLKPGGVCYFAATNRLKLVEAHYHLPFLSILPRFLAHIYIRLAGKASFYHEMHFSFWKLKNLVKKFKRIDYTKELIENSDKFETSYLFTKGSLKAKIAIFIVQYATWLCPGYIWLLKKE